MQEWSERIVECRSSGKSVRAWCNEQGISVQTYYWWEKRFVEKVTQQFSLPSPTQAGILMRVNPDAMPGSDVADIENGITIRHGESAIGANAGEIAPPAHGGFKIAAFFGQRLHGCEGTEACSKTAGVVWQDS